MDFAPRGADGLRFPLEQWYMEVPVVTRWYLTCIALTSVLVKCEVLSPYSLFYSTRAVFTKGQYWRLFTTFFFFNSFGLDLVVQLFFLHRYSRLLEESAGRSPANFSWMMLLCSCALIALGAVFPTPYLGNCLSFVMMYVWSRRNPNARLSLLGIFSFRAPFLPWVLMAFNYILHGYLPKEELCGTLVGHAWYYLNDIYPPINRQHKPLEPPLWWVGLWQDQPAVEETENNVNPPLVRNL